MFEAIKKLMEMGCSETEARQEFNDKVNYYMRGTGHSTEDRTYAVECAVDDIMNDDVEEVAEEHLAMLNMIYA